MRERIIYNIIQQVQVFINTKIYQNACEEDQINEFAATTALRISYIALLLVITLVLFIHTLQNCYAFRRLI